MKGLMPEFKSGLGLAGEQVVKKSEPDPFPFSLAFPLTHMLFAHA
jgi:hypothetical protein